MRAGEQSPSGWMRGRGGVEWRESTARCAHRPAATGNLGDSYIDAIAAAVRHSQRPATRRAYEGAWQRFRAWAEAEGVRSLPAEPLTVAAYLAHRAAAGLSVASLAMDREVDQPLPPRRGPSHATRRWRACARPSPDCATGPPRRAATSRARARGLNAEALEAIRGTAHLPRSGAHGPDRVGRVRTAPGRRGHRHRVGHAGARCSGGPRLRRSAGGR